MTALNTALKDSICLGNKTLSNNSLLSINYFYKNAKAILADSGCSYLSVKRYEILLMSLT